MIEIVPASTDMLPGTPTVVDLPYGAVKIKNAEWAFDKPLLGLAPKMMDLEINFNIVGNDAAFNAFYDALFEPTVEHDLDAVNMPGEKFKTGTIVRWYINGNLQYRGVQLEGIWGEFDGQNDIVEVHFEDLFMTTLKQLSLKPLGSWIERLGVSSYTFRKAYFDQLIERDISGDGNRYLAAGSIIGTGVLDKSDVNYGFGFIKIDDVLSEIRSYAQIIYDAMTREDQTGFILNKPNYTHYYHQTYADTGVKGGALNASELYLLGCMRYDGEYVGGLFNKDEQHSLYSPSRYANVYDFMQDWFFESLSKSEVFSDGNPPDKAPFVPARIFEDANATIALNMDIMLRRYYRTRSKSDKPTIKAHTQDMSIERVVSSMTEVIGNDISKWEAVEKGDRNGNSENLSIVFSNHPSLPDKSNYYSSNYKNSWQPRKFTCLAFNIKFFHASDSATALNYNLYPHINNIYYFDNPSALDDTGKSMPFRVHDHCYTELRSTLNSEDLPGCGDPGFNPADSKYRYEDYPDAFIEMQDQSCKPRHQALALREIYKNLHELELKVDYDLIDSGVSGQDLIWWLWGVAKEFTFDASEIHPRLTGLPEKWYLNECELNDDDEVATVKLIASSANG